MMQSVTRAAEPESRTHLHDVREADAVGKQALRFGQRTDERAVGVAARIVAHDAQQHIEHEVRELRLVHQRAAAHRPGA